jgi:hypothetical protein
MDEIGPRAERLAAALRTLGGACEAGGKGPQGDDRLADGTT